MAAKRLIISRKGFDSTRGPRGPKRGYTDRAWPYGGVPSPIFPDGSMYSLPVPGEDEDITVTYGDLSHQVGGTQVNIGRVVELTRVCKGFSGRGMVGDFQVGLGFRPGFGQQPDAAPEAALSSNRRSQSMPWRMTLTVRTGLPQRSRRLGVGALGGVRRLPGAILRSWASSTRVP